MSGSDIESDGYSTYTSKDLQFGWLRGKMDARIMLLRIRVLPPAGTNNVVDRPHYSSQTTDETRGVGNNLPFAGFKN